MDAMVLVFEFGTTGRFLITQAMSILQPENTVDICQLPTSSET
ncbi:hypothetical protein PENARI_c099G10407, partial [Penicillium arizonense]